MSTLGRSSLTSSTSSIVATGSCFPRSPPLPKRAAREPGDEPVEERVVEKRERDRRDEGRRHQPLPEEDVAADELGEDARRDRLLLGGRDERQRVDEVVEDEREGEDDGGQD